MGLLARRISIPGQNIYTTIILPCSVWSWRGRVGNDAASAENLKFYLTLSSVMALLTRLTCKAELVLMAPAHGCNTVLFLLAAKR